MLYASVDKHKWLPGSDVCFAKHNRHTRNITMRKILEWYVINDVTLYQLYYQTVYFCLVNGQLKVSILWRNTYTLIPHSEQQKNSDCYQFG